MAELIYKGMLKNCYAGDFRMDGKTPSSATYASIRKMIDMQPIITEAEIKAKAYEEVFELLRSKRDKKTMRVNLDDLEIRKYMNQLKEG